MYEVIKNVIQNGAYILSDMLVKIDTSWIRGYITEEEKSELIRLARDNATNLYKSVDNAYSSFVNSTGGKILENSLGVKFPKGDKPKRQFNKSTI